MTLDVSNRAKKRFTILIWIFFLVVKIQLSIDSIKIGKRTIEGLEELISFSEVDNMGIFNQKNRMQ